MPSEKIEQTNQKEFLENYQDLLDLYKDTNKLLELNDNFSETILDLPDPEEKNTYSFESEKEEIDDKYKNFYYLRSRFYRKVSRMRENEVFLDQNLSSLTDDWRLDLVDVLNKLKVILEDLNNKRNLIDVTVLRSVLVSDLGTFRTELESIKDKISNEARKKVREISNANKKDSNIDSNTVYDYRNTAATMKKNEINRTTIEDTTVRDVINNKLEQIEQKSRTIRFIMNAIKSIKNANIIESINEKINDSPVIFQYLIKGYEALQNMTEEEKIQAKFLKDLINLNYNINEEETFKKDARDIESYYRERARKRFDHNSGFCDEELDINGNWVLKENAQIANRLILAKKKLLRKFREASYDDH